MCFDLVVYHAKYCQEVPEFFSRFQAAKHPVYAAGGGPFIGLGQATAHVFHVFSGCSYHALGLEPCHGVPQPHTGTMSSFVGTAKALWRVLTAGYFELHSTQRPL
jgi:hypothetical protein